MSQQTNPIAINVANFLRNHQLLKQRQGLFNGSVVDFFRFKRVVRALLSEEYKAKSANPKNQLPKIEELHEAKNVFALLINNRLVLRGQKLHTQEAREQNLSPKKDFPCFTALPKAELTDDEYYIWLYEKKSVWQSVMAFGLIIGVFTLICFPLWPMFMRKGVWYLSVFFLGLLGLLFVIAIVRLILFLVTLVVAKPGIWLFPNLFEDVSFIESFKPFYAWNLPKEKKVKKSKKSESQSPIASADAAAAAAAPPTSTGSESSTSTTTKRKVILEEVEE